jgi:uncharacterized membrane protein
MKTFLLAISSILVSVLAQFLLKQGMATAKTNPVSGWADPMTFMFQPYIMAGFVAYGLGALLWLQVLAVWDVSKAYPLVGLGFVVATGVGILLGEAVGPQRLAGVLLICAGIVVVALS